MLNRKNNEKSVKNSWQKVDLQGNNNQDYEKCFNLEVLINKADMMQYPVKDCHEMVQDKKGRIVLLTNETKKQYYIDKSKFINTKNYIIDLEDARD